MSPRRPVSSDKRPRSSTVPQRRAQARRSPATSLRAVLDRSTAQRARYAPFVDLVDDLEWGARRVACDEVERMGPWHVFSTFTFRKSVTPPQVESAVRALAMRLSREKLHQHVRVAWVIDQQPASGRLHVHCLLGFCEPLPDWFEPRHVAFLWATLPSWRGTSRTQNDAQWFEIDRRGHLYFFLKHRDAMWSTACTRKGRCAHRRCAIAAHGWPDPLRVLPVRLREGLPRPRRR